VVKSVVSTVHFDVMDLPFSRRGSWLAISWIKASDPTRHVPEGLYLRTVRDRGDYQQLFRIDLPADGGREIRAEASPSIMHLFPGGTKSERSGVVDVCIPTTSSVRFRGRGTLLRLSSIPGPELSYAIPRGEGSWIVNMLGAGLRLMLTPLRGKLHVDAPWQAQGSQPMRFEMHPDIAGEFDIVIEEFAQALTPKRLHPPFEDEAAAVEADFLAFAARHGGEGPFSETADIARYILWSCIVNPEGAITRPTVLATKDRLTGIWSWDHCFTALALCPGDPALAWNQIMTIFDHQDEFGALPDAVFDRRVVQNFTKPPVHGWAIGRMLKLGCLDRAMKEEAYLHLARWTDFWFSYRDYDGDGVPQYDHGNDSGWDNASPFIFRPPLEAPDLATFLILQMDTLAVLADELERSKEAIAWREKSTAFLRLATSHLTRRGRMGFVVSGTHEEIPNESLLPYLQLLLGNRLTESTRTSLLKSLEEEGYITQWGIATESTLSRHYSSDGYWLGPIWAPSTFLMVDALFRSGENNLAKEIGSRFLDLVETSGFAENFDAITGAPLRDRAFAWTASTYLILARDISARP
jgi:hypothetical protein